MKDLLKKKSVLIALCVFNLFFCVYCLTTLTRQAHGRAVKSEFFAAVNEFEKSPPGIERADVFVKRLKAIDPGYSSPEVKEALRDYTSSLEQSLTAVKTGQNTTRYDEAVLKAKQRLIAAWAKVN